MPLFFSSVCDPFIFPALIRSALISSVVNVLLHIYAVYACPEEDDSEAPRENRAKYGSANGGFINGRTRTNSESQRIQDADAFELQGLISEDDEEAGTSTRPRKTDDEEVGVKESHA